MEAKKYIVNKNIIILNNLLVEGDFVFIKNYDPVAGRPQKVFLHDRTLIGSISSDEYWKVDKMLTVIV